MLRDDVLEGMYQLAYCLHPDNGVALSVTLEACERLVLIRRLQDRHTGHYRIRLPEACLPQYCVYLASDARERAQERPRPGQKPRYQPSPDDWLVRYIKALVWWTMDRNACHVAVALGCFLYGYQPGEIVSLAPEVFNHYNIRRVKARLAQPGLSADERRAYEQLVSTYKQVAYATMMGTRPQTLYGIADSPVGLAAWMLDHNDSDGQPAAAVVAALRRATSAAGELTRDEILDNITLTWLTNTGDSGARIYWENKFSYFNAKNHSVPTAVSVFPGEQYQAPRSWTERAYHKLIYYNKVDKGGHFAAWEQPQLFSEEIRAAFRSLR